MTVQEPKIRVIGCLVVLLTTCGGCGGRPWFGEVLKRSNSYDFKGETVEINFLTREGLRDYKAMDPTAQAQYDARLKNEFPALYGGQNEIAAVAAVIPLLAGMAVDAVKADLDREAEIFEAQFDAAVHKSGFWKSVGTTGTPKFLGFEVVRRTAAAPQPAYRLVCAMVPANLMKTDDPPSDQTADERIFVIRPLLFQTARSKAKVFMLNKKLDSEVNIALDATWIDRAQNVHQERVATADFAVKNYDLKGTPILVDELKPHIAGWFGGVPVSRDKDDNPKGNGTFKMTVVVTEKDQSGAKPLIERTAKLVSDKKTTIVQAVTPK